MNTKKIKISAIVEIEENAFTIKIQLSLLYKAKI